jgi:hypothetical protein
MTAYPHRPDCSEVWALVSLAVCALLLWGLRVPVFHLTRSSRLRDYYASRWADYEMQLRRLGLGTVQRAKHTMCVSVDGYKLRAERIRPPWNKHEPN